MKLKENVVVKNSVILNLIQNLQHWPLPLVNSLCGRFQIKFGMTPLLNHGGFTLIELLVVVLIIAILAAVALPEYQKAVRKARVVSIEIKLKSIYEAARLCYLEKGAICQRSELSIEIPTECERLEGYCVSYAATQNGRRLPAAYSYISNAIMFTYDPLFGGETGFEGALYCTGGDADSMCPGYGFTKIMDAGGINSAKIQLPGNLYARE